jgi:hypothetical protein
MLYNHSLHKYICIIVVSYTLSSDSPGIFQAGNKYAFIIQRIIKKFGLTQKLYDFGRKQIPEKGFCSVINKPGEAGILNAWNFKEL